MGPAAVIMFVIGVPLILIGIGFIILVTKVFSNSDGRAERAQTLEAARHLEKTLNSMEARLSALEDILLSSTPKKGDQNYE